MIRAAEGIVTGIRHAASVSPNPVEILLELPLTVNLKFFAARILLAALLFAGQKMFSAEPPPVTCVETENTFTFDNGILRAEIEKRNGNLVSLVFQGHELLTQNGGYWSSVGRNTSRTAPGNAALLQTGTNIFKLTSFANNWTQAVMYDCVRLEFNENN